MTVGLFISAVMMSSFASVLGIEEVLKFVNKPADIQWIDVGTNTLYYIERTWRVTWYNAAWQCRTMGLKYSGQEGRLASFKSADEINLLRRYFKDMHDSLWIGLSRDGIDDFTWTDNSPPNYTNWREGEPNDHGSEYCTLMITDTTLWNDNPCNVLTLYVCAVDKVQIQDCSPKLRGWKLFNNNCYLTRSAQDDALDWISAEQYCVLRKAHLVSVVDYREEAFISNRITDKPESLHRLWSGLKYDENKTNAVWTDGFSSPLSIFEKPNQSGCVSFNPVIEQWEVVPCTRKIGYICKMPLLPIHKHSSCISENESLVLPKENRDSAAIGGDTVGITIDILMTLLSLSSFV